MCTTNTLDWKYVNVEKQKVPLPWGRDSFLWLWDVRLERMSFCYYLVSTSKMVLPFRSWVGRKLFPTGSVPPSSVFRVSSRNASSWDCEIPTGCCRERSNYFMLSIRAPFWVVIGSSPSYSLPWIPSRRQFRGNLAWSATRCTGKTCRCYAAKNWLVETLSGP